ncbi:MAG TPA: glycosyltransferase family 39 protein, partial [Candidatus Saccharimonadales bacterium]|nr:glycosyltransferase family 39 protein [Candidatus Saccharimonadales bacterium]
MSGAKGGWIGRGLLLILALSALFRAGYLWQYHAESAFYQDLILDAHLYDEWAGRIAGGEVVPAEPFYFAPGYPYALALVYRFVSSARIAVYVLQALLGLGCIVLVHRIACLAYGARAALFAAGLTALYGSFPFLESKIMSAILALATLLAAMAALASAALRSRPWLWALGGLLFGVTSLIRPETLLAGPFLLVWLFLASGKGGEEEGSGPLWRRRLPAAALLAGGWALAIAPDAAHNILAGGGRTLISSQGGITFYQSNNPRARGLYTSLSGEGFSGDPGAQATEEKQIAEKAAGRPLDRSEVSSYWFRRGLSFIAGHPGRFLWLEGMKLLRYAGSYEYSGEYIIYVERERVWLLWLTFVPFALILALALPSVWPLVRRPILALAQPSLWPLVRGPNRRHPKSKRKESGPGP